MAGVFTEESTEKTLDLSRRGLKKIEKALPEESQTITNLILDQNELQRLDGIETYTRVENVSYFPKKTLGTRKSSVRFEGK